MAQANDAGFLSQGFRELGRKLDRFRLRRTIRQQESLRVDALAALGQKAWDDRIDLGAHAGLRDRLAGLDARAGELSQSSSRLEHDKGAREAQRLAELEKFTARRGVVETKKSPVDAALREARARRTACEQAIKQAERAKPAGEQGAVGANLTASRAQLPGLVAEESRLAAESRKHAAEIAAVDAEQKAAVGLIDKDLARVRSELQGASQQTGAVQKERAAAFGELGSALFADAPVAALHEPAAHVASIDRSRAQSRATLDTSLADSKSVGAATMAKFWGVVLGVPLVLAAAGAGTYQYMHRSAPVAAVPAYVAQKRDGECDIQAPPEKGKGVGVRSNCVRHEGIFVDGVLESGKIIYPDGRVAEGVFVGGQQFGEGKLTWKDGRRYEGMFLEGRSWGSGAFVAADGTQFSGSFEPGVRLIGIGMRKSPDGSVLVGEFVAGKPSRKMVLVKDGKAEAVEVGNDGSIVKTTASPEPIAK